MSYFGISPVFGIHSVTICDYKTGLPLYYGMLKVLGSAENTNETEEKLLQGGSNKHPWAVEDGKTTLSVGLTVRQMEESLMKSAVDATLTKTAASATGSVFDFANFNGVSAVSATTGIATATLKTGETADVKNNIYIGKVITPTTVDIYQLTDVDNNVGTELSFDTANKITAAPLTIATATAVEIAGTGIELTGGSGTIAMIAGDTFIFSSAKPHAGIRKYVIGETGSKPEYVKLVMVAEKLSDGTTWLCIIHKAKALNLPISFNESEFSEFTLNFTPIYDTAKNATVEYIQITGE